MKKMLIALILGVLLVPQVAFALSLKKPSFPDVPNDHAYAKSIRWMKDNEVISGYADGDFKSEILVSRAEFLKILYKAKGMHGASGAMNFSDVSQDDWFYPYVKEAYLTGVVKGYGDGTFMPGGEITFAEAVKIVSNAYFSVDDWYNSTPYDKCYKDLSWMADESGSWYWKFFYVADNFCVIPDFVMYYGISDFDPSLKVTRGDMVEMIYRAKAVVDSSSDSSTMVKYDGKIHPDQISHPIPDGEPLGDEALYFDPMTAKVGDMVGNWEVSKVSAAIGEGDLDENNFSVEFSGSATVSGVYANLGEFADVYYLGDLTEDSLAKLPAAINTDRSNVWFGFSNHDFAKSEFYSPYHSGNATVKIKDYVVNYAEAEIWDTAKLVDVVSKDDSKISSLCSDPATEREGIGGTELPIDEIFYPDLYWLGQLFTAYDCSKQRVQEHMFVDGDDYTGGSSLWLKNPPSAELMDVFSDIGFVCAEDLDLASCDFWDLTKTVKWTDMIKLKPFSGEMLQDDCTLCG